MIHIKQEAEEKVKNAWKEEIGKEEEENNLFQIEQEILACKQERREEMFRHHSTVRELEDRLYLATKRKEILLADLDLEKVHLAKSILKIRNHDFDKTCIEDAIQDILNDTPVMRTQYFGSKHYSHYRFQRSDHRYFMGPSHGTIVFSIGLVEEHRKGLSSKQAEACLYYLNLLLDDNTRHKVV